MTTSPLPSLWISPGWAATPAPLWAPSAICTPHCGYSMHESERPMWEQLPTSPSTIPTVCARPAPASEKFWNWTSSELSTRKRAGTKVCWNCLPSVWVTTTGRCTQDQVCSTWTKSTGTTHRKNEIFSCLATVFQEGRERTKRWRVSRPSSSDCA